jgi:hypothetical protein
VRSNSWGDARSKWGARVAMGDARWGRAEQLGGRAVGGARSKLGGAQSKEDPMTGNALCTMHKDGLMQNNLARSQANTIRPTRVSSNNVYLRLDP